MNDNKKVYIGIIVCILILFIILLLTLGIPNMIEEGKKITLLVDHDTTWVYRNKKWSNLTDSEQLKEYDWKKFHIYSNNEKVGSYYLWRDDRWYAFDKDKNAIMVEGNFFAYQANYTLDIFPFTMNTISDMTYVNEVLKENNIPTNSAFTSSYVISLDMDDDDTLEDIYAVTNAFDTDHDSEKTFTFVFMVKNKKIYPIYEEIDDKDYYNGCKPYFTAFIDLGNDSKYEFIFNCGKYSVMTPIRRLYQFHDNEFKILVSNE